MKRKGFKEVEAKLENIAEKDWAYNVGKTDDILKVFENKLKNLTLISKKLRWLDLDLQGQ